MSAISTHVLDTTSGLPAAKVPVKLEVHAEDSGWMLVGEGATDADGRFKFQSSAGPGFAAGSYRLTFDTGSYFRAQKLKGLYPEVAVVFTVRDSSRPYHIPLLLNPHGYTTYRGS